MKRIVLLVSIVAICFVALVGKAALAAESASVYLVILRSPPNRHVIAMDSMAACRRAAEFSKAKCVSSLPRLPDSSTGVLRSADWSPGHFAGASATAPNPVLYGKDFGPVYLVVRQSPPNRHVIAMASMNKCLEAAAFTSAKCLEKLPKLPDSSTGQFRSLAESP